MIYNDQLLLCCKAVQVLKWRCLPVTGIPLAHRCVPSPVHSCPSSRSGCKWLLQCANARGTGSAKDPELPVLVETIHATSGASWEGYCWQKSCTWFIGAVLYAGRDATRHQKSQTFRKTAFGELCSFYVCKECGQ